MKKVKTARQLATREVMFPRDTNGQGNIFGGVLLSQIDVAGAIAAYQHCARTRKQPMVTRAMDRIEFREPVFVNDVVTCYGRITSVGKTSLTVHVEVEVDRGGRQLQVTEADVTYVAVDRLGRPQEHGCSKRPGRKGQRKTAPVAGAASLPPAAPAAERVLAARRTMMPRDTNGMGNIFGGVLLSEMDLAGSYVARRACKNSFIARCVTRFMDKVEFKQPVHVGDVLTCWGQVMRIGNTSVTVHVEVEADRGGKIIPVTHADITYVALDRDGRPATILCSSKAKGTQVPGEKVSGQCASAACAGTASSEQSACPCPDGNASSRRKRKRRQGKKDRCRNVIACAGLRH